MRWLEERGLSVPDPMPEHTTHGVLPICGTYRQRMHITCAEFDLLIGQRTRTLSNGEWTLAIITTDSDNLRTVHTLNPNVRDRPVFDYAESRATYG